MSPILVRFAVSLALIALGVGVYVAYNRLNLRRLRRPAAGPTPGLDSLRPGVAGILYFTTPDCQVCRAAQRPALERLQVALGGHLQVIEIDASDRTSIADHWGVLSVPTTFIIDAQGRPRRVNHGLTSAERLLRQLEVVDARLSEHVTQPVEVPVPGLEA